MINDFLKLPIVKLIAMIALILYIFEKTKNDPSSISHQINKENIAKSIDIVKQNMQNASNLKEGIKNNSENECVLLFLIQRNDVVSFKPSSLDKRIFNIFGINGEYGIVILLFSNINAEITFFKLFFIA